MTTASLWRQRLIIHPDTSRFTASDPVTWSCFFMRTMNRDLVSSLAAVSQGCFTSSCYVWDQRWPVHHRQCMRKVIMASCYWLGKKCADDWWFSWRQWRKKRNRGQYFFQLWRFFLTATWGNPEWAASGTRDLTTKVFIARKGYIVTMYGCRGDCVWRQP